MKRKLWKGKRVGFVADEPFWLSLLKYRAKNDRVEVTASFGDLVSSHVKNSKKHVPTIDLDGDFEIVQTSPGHYHLYSETEISWPTYVLLLYSLYRAGLIEKGFFYWSLRRGGTFLKPDWQVLRSSSKAEKLTRPKLYAGDSVIRSKP